MWKRAEPEDPQTQPQPQPQPVVPTHSSPAAQSNKVRAAIGTTIHIKGDLKGEEDLLIEGTIEGRIELRKHNITVGANGHVKADLYGKVISIEGEVEGNLFGEDQLILRQSSNVRGNITAPRVILEDGCNFRGSIDMGSGNTSPKPESVHEHARPEGHADTAGRPEADVPTEQSILRP